MKAKILTNKHFVLGHIDERIYGSFIEHLGRAVYEGIYAPDHPSADEDGFRTDVLDAVKRLNVPIVRYPGGNFVSGYHWEDGTGDKSRRPRRMDLAWNALEPNEVGIDEFQAWASKANAQVMMAVNLGTGGVEDAANCVEYCNSEQDTCWAEKRRENGFAEPFRIKTWCLGNELDGPWQIGRKTSVEYARLAGETAKVMKRVDPDIELVVCGSSYPGMPTFGQWEYDVLNECYEAVDYLSLHSYYNNISGDTPRFLAQAEVMDAFIKGTAAICDAVKAKKHSDKVMMLSFDEWNVWYNQNNPPYEQWKVAQHRLEEDYSFEDALTVGCLLQTLQNNCDRVKIACLAQLVNVIAPIRTESSGALWLQSIYYPFLYASNYGRGVCMRTVVESEAYSVEGIGSVDYLKASVIHNAQAREIVVFATNRNLTESVALELCFEDFGACRIVEHVELYHEELKCKNSAEVENIKPGRVEICRDVGERLRVSLKKHSWNMIRVRY